MSTKKYLLFFVCLVSVNLLSSCSSNKKEIVHCDISGVIKGNNYAEGLVYLKDIAGHEILDSTRVDGGVFQFKKLERDTVYAALLILKSSTDDLFPSLLPVMIEPGELKAEMGEGYVCISGSPLNEKMQDFLQGIDKISDQMHKEKYSPEKARQAFVEFLVAQIDLNKDNAVSTYIRQAYDSRLTNAKR